RAWYSTSPERSPVNIRPVRLAPCAAGARPTITSRASAGPNPGTGLPQYISSAKAARFVTATCSRHSTSRGHARQSISSRSRSASVRTTHAILAGQPFHGVGGTGHPAVATYLGTHLRRTACLGGRLVDGRPQAAGRPRLGGTHPGADRHEHVGAGRLVDGLRDEHGRHSEPQ